MKIDYGFACQDDCLDKMVPSDLRKLICERDHYRRYALELKSERENLLAHIRHLEECLEQRKCVAVQAFDANDSLKAERDALAAQVDALRDAASEAAEALGFLSHHLQGRMGDTALMDMAEKADALNDALNVSPQQHLAEIRAEAGWAGFIAGAFWESNQVVNGVEQDSEAEANQYADSIRQGVK